MQPQPKLSRNHIQNATPNEIISKMRSGYPTDWNHWENKIKMRTLGRPSPKRKPLAVRIGCGLFAALVNIPNFTNNISAMRSEIRGKFKHCWTHAFACPHSRASINRIQNLKCVSFLFCLLAHACTRARVRVGVRGRADAWTCACACARLCARARVN